jgi:glycosyltransferase involved in cell wall biosynthesis
MPRFSLILPCIQPTPAFEDTLASLLRTRPRSAEVIVVHDGNYQDEYGLEGEVGYAVANKKRLVAYWNAGLEASGGEFIVWIRPGVQLDDGWEADCLREFENPRVGCVGPRLNVEGSGAKQAVFGVATTRTGTRQLKTENKGQLLGPSSWVAAYRQSALGWLDALDLVWEDEYLDAFLGLALRRLGYEYRVAPDWDAMIDGPAATEVFAKRPHGLSATRAAVRFGGPLVAGIGASLQEDLASFFSQSWRLRHFRGRFKASRFRSADLHAAQQLAQHAARREQILAQTASQTRRAA